MKLYKTTLNDAIRNDKVEEYTNSIYANKACAHSIEEAIIDNYHDCRLNVALVVKQVLDVYGFDRTIWVAAASLQRHEGDSRISRDNMKWTHEVIFPYIDLDRDCRSYLVSERIHVGLLDMFVSELRRQYEAARLLEEEKKDRIMLRVFQTNNRDVRFMDYKYTLEHGGIKPETYKEVWGGTLKARNLDDIFMELNLKKPLGYYAPSLSVSDVVQVVSSDTIDPGFFFVDSIGFKRFNAPLGFSNQATFLKVLILEKNKVPYEAEIPYEEKPMQHIVGGSLKKVRLDSQHVLIVNKTANQPVVNDNERLQANRFIGSTLYYGNAFIVGLSDDGEELRSLTDEDVERLTATYINSY